MSQYDLSEFKNKKIALVLSGGVVKAAAWHIGVTLALEELGFILKNNRNSSDLTFRPERPLEISTYVGSSAGAMVSAFLAQGFSPQEIINGVFGLTKKSSFRRLKYKDMFYLNKRKFKPLKDADYNPFSEFPFPIKTLLHPFIKFPGPFSTEGARQYLVKEILETESFEDFIPDLFVVGTQLDHSCKTIFGKPTTVD